ncbi:hypothetical protein [Nocardioides zhouii]|uniref:Uncharacterized protein n=1 Tax=Nocardioides zhouii TaxID=1168729 RepID=A0A4Q2T734_9ACTN|nr:hypothetical protein [Nocardioides zhouii]RYC14562.1 hypothetical protein EUA94_00075 [Nocardioides zhouii]
MTASQYLRIALERALAEESGVIVGAVETATRDQLDRLSEDLQGDLRAAVALELARRLDVDPSNGAQHARELGRLLTELEKTYLGSAVDRTPVEEIRSRRLLRLLGYGITAPDGRQLSQPNPNANTDVSRLVSFEPRDWHPVDDLAAAGEWWSRREEFEAEFGTNLPIEGVGPDAPFDPDTL